MTNEELKQALLTGKTVENTDFLHSFSNVIVSAIIYRVKDGKLHITAELKDKSNTTYTADPKYIFEPKKAATHCE